MRWMIRRNKRFILLLRGGALAQDCRGGGKAARGWRETRTMRNLSRAKEGYFWMLPRNRVTAALGAIQCLRGDTGTGLLLRRRRCRIRAPR